MWLSSLFYLVFAGLWSLSACDDAVSFAFGNTQGDYMVLQQAPYRSQVWGFSPQAGDSISVTLKRTTDGVVLETVNAVTQNNNIWQVQLLPVVGKNDVEYEIAAQLINSGQQLILQHLLFGDVFVCSGQSNMQMTVSQANNSTAEIANANNYPNIRVFTVALTNASSPQNELIGIAEGWNVAGSSSVGGADWDFLSALCWFYGRDLFEYLNYPVGLIASSYGGTPIRYWMPAETLQQCNETDLPGLSDSSLWNAMIYPLLRSTIRGVIWYQGEADCAETYSTLYSCAFPVMIDAWRYYWSTFTDSDAMFPFGFIQLSVWDDSVNSTCGNSESCAYVAQVRWGQTANFGYVPNPRMVNTYMATAIDLGDPTSPYGDIHPRYKQQVAARLSQAAINVIYGESELYWLGPVAYKASVSTDMSSIVISFRNVGNSGLQIKNSVGFELMIGNSWQYNTNEIVLTPEDGFAYQVVIKNSNANNVRMVRYNWYTAPCMPLEGIYQCAVYDQMSQLPATPFILSID